MPQISEKFWEVVTSFMYVISDVMNVLEGPMIF